MTSFRNYRKGDPVLVRATGVRGEVKGRVQELAGKGAFVKKADGHQNFYYWNQMRPDSSEPRKTESPTAKLADVVPPDLLEKVAGAQQPAKLTLVKGEEEMKTPISIQTKAGSAGGGSDAASKPDKLLGPNSPGFQPIRTGRNFGIPRKNMKLRVRSDPRRPTKIGSELRRLRLEHSYTQENLALATGIQRGRLVHLELGDAIPNKEEIERLSSVFKTKHDAVWRESVAKRQAENEGRYYDASKNESKDDLPDLDKWQPPEDRPLVGVKPSGDIAPLAPPAPRAPEPVRTGKIRMKIGDVEVEADTPQEAAALIKALKGEA